MDYRLWIKDGDWNRFNEEVLREIDQAVEWGRQYGVHVCLNFHRAPGYTVAQPAEPMDLWTDAETQAVCARHWAMFATRYHGIPSTQLSFNLMNEPSKVDGPTYARVVARLLEAIHAEDPGRLVIADGLDWGTKPCLELCGQAVAQATRGYQPFHLTHYRATWVGNTDWMPSPAWPRPLVHGVLYGPMKPDLTGPLRITGPFAVATRLRLHVGTVTQRGTLRVKADGKPVFERAFACGAGTGEWRKSVLLERWKVYQCEFDCDCAVEIAAGTQAVELDLSDGDWLTIPQLGFSQGQGAEQVLALPTSWGVRPAPIGYVPRNGDSPFTAEKNEDRQWLWDNTIAAWKRAEAQGVGVMVGEWGAFNKTPHAVVLRWMEDCLRNWQQAGWGWALWNFRGSFGVLDSGRPDVQYEDFEGHKLDRQMLELLQRY